MLSKAITSQFWLVLVIFKGVSLSLLGLFNVNLCASKIPLLLSPLCVQLFVIVQSPFMVVFPGVKTPSMVVFLYNVILLVVGNPMYGKPLTFNKY